MSDISKLDHVGVKPKISSKNSVSLDQTKNIETKEMKSLEITMEEANHAFALMTEIRQKIESAYHDLKSNLE